MRDFALEDGKRKPIKGNSPAKDSARFRPGFENVACVSKPGHEPGSGKPGRARPHDGDSFRTGGEPLNVWPEIAALGRIGDKPLERVDGYGLVKFPAVAYSFTRVETDPAADARERVLLQDQFPGFPEKPLGIEHFDTRRIFSGRTGAAARCLLISNLRC